MRGHKPMLADSSPVGEHGRSNRSCLLLGGEQMSLDETGTAGSPTVSVVIATYSMDRWDGLRETVASVKNQTAQVLETTIVVDHHPGLMAKASKELGVAVVPNTALPGASGARNSGVAVSKGEIIVFLDDDITAMPSLIEKMLEHFKDSAVVGVGTLLEPSWDLQRPSWFPHEFDWVIGCSYRGMPERVTPVRNVWSGSMAIRRNVFEAIEGFRIGFGKVGTRNRPEDTDLCLRATEFFGEGIWLYEPSAIAKHKVPPERATFRYFVRRCYYEGLGKATLVHLNGATVATSAELEYTRRVLPTALWRGLLEAMHGNLAGGQRSSAIAAGFVVTVWGFMTGRIVGAIQAK
jgi:glycosyltransferase involved in cell wall biosynthesis